MADHIAIAFVRLAPGAHSAVISASVVGYAMPAESPPTNRATTSTSSDGAHAARRQAGIDRLMPNSTIILRPYRSPSAPSQSTEPASPSE